MKQRLLRCVSHLERTRLAWRDVEGFQVTAVGEAGELAQLSAGIRLLGRVDPRRLRRAQRHTPYVTVSFTDRSSYDPDLRACRLASGSCESALEVAGTLVHESTHGRLHDLGFAYTAQSRERHERVCLEEEHRFVRRALLTDAAGAEESGRRLEALARWKQAMLDSRWWEQHPGRLAVLRQLLRELRR
jgi:hypothetical protein